ncbi:hypothetical protein, partial [Streptomyces violaceorubidus]|uniref:hypothetical protein n=1 Tax=Streptomyces violaceorubidus TaxID=284042 RepID=UPI001AE0B4A9
MRSPSSSESSSGSLNRLPARLNPGVVPGRARAGDSARSPAPYSPGESTLMSSPSSSDSLNRLPARS